MARVFSRAGGRMRGSSAATADRPICTCKGGFPLLADTAKGPVPNRNKVDATLGHPYPAWRSSGSRWFGRMLPS